MQNEVQAGIEFVGEHLYDVRKQIVGNILRLLDNDLSVPFIARYRKQETGGMEADKIRQIQHLFETYRKIQKRAQSIIKTMGDEATPKLKEGFVNAKSLEELEELYAPYKKGAKGTLADRARKLGLGDVATQILNTPHKDVYMRQHVGKTPDGPKNEEEVRTGIQHIIAELVSKDPMLKQFLKNQVEPSQVHLTCKASAKAGDLDKGKKFATYYNFSSYTHRLQAFQVLAINRGDQQKILTVKMEIQNRRRLQETVLNSWLPQYGTAMNRKIISDAVEDSLKRLVEKSFLRRVRTKLTKQAEIEAANVFSTNLKHLLLVAPVKNKNVLSIDPGFRNGCKVAVLNKNGSKLYTGVIHPFNANTKEAARKQLIDLVRRHRVGVIAIGNGTACRETEAFISEMIKNDEFKPADICYSIVNESGASIYSVTEEAKKEFGHLDPNLISAVSIGRRLQDPLLEMVKIEAKHIGIGMYQHDIDANLLKCAEESVIEDCVSFIGVDLNATSADMLKRVAGISKKQAEAIVAHRTKTGDFINRDELQTVKGIGKVTYQNCAGFVRIVPRNSDLDYDSDEETKDDITTEGNGKKRKLGETSSPLPSSKKRKTSKNLKPEPLDQTWIHPESYGVAKKVLKHLNASSDMIGTERMKNTISDLLGDDGRLQELVTKLETDRDTLKLIVEGLQQPSDYDMRTTFSKPVFKTGLTSIDQLKSGQVVSGAVANVTSFGIFVDIGVGQDGLMHSSCVPKGMIFGPGDRVECSIISTDIERNRISLGFKEKSSKAVCLR